MAGRPHGRPHDGAVPPRCPKKRRTPLPPAARPIAGALARFGPTGSDAEAVRALFAMIGIQASKPTTAIDALDDIEPERSCLCLQMESLRGKLEPGSRQTLPRPAQKLHRALRRSRQTARTSTAANTEGAHARRSRTRSLRSRGCTILWGISAFQGPSPGWRPQGLSASGGAFATEISGNELLIPH
jgi:hypothetical protein